MRRASTALRAFAFLVFACAAVAAAAADRVLGKNLGRIVDMAFSDDGRWLVAATDKGDVLRLFDLSDDRQAGSINDSPGGARSVTFIPGTRNVVAAGWYRGSGLWVIRWEPEARKATLKRMQLNSSKNPAGIAVRPDGAAMSAFDAPPAENSGRFADIVRTWDSATGKELEPRLGIEGDPVRSAWRPELLAYGPDGKTLATVIMPNVGAMTGIKRLDTTSGKSLPDLTWRTESGVLAIAYRRDAKSIAAGERKAIRIIDLESRKISTLSTGAASLAFRPDGRGLAFGSAEGGIVGYLDFESQKARRVGAHEPADVEVTSVAFSPDGRTLASGNEYGEIRLWSLGP